MVVRGMAILLLCQLAGEIVSRGLALSIPGPVLGLVLLVAGLFVQGRRGGDAAVEASAAARVGDGLLTHLALLFVPAGVGVIQYGDVLRREALPLAGALVGSTALTLVVTVLVFVGTARLLGRRAGDATGAAGR